MIGQPFRSAFWVMIFGLGLCVCLLIAEPQRPLPPLQFTSLSPEASDAVQSATPDVATAVDDTIANTAAVETTPVGPEIAGSSLEEQDQAEIDVVDVDLPPTPVRDVLEIDPAPAAMPVVEAIDRVPTEARFEELPPPPEVIESVDGPSCPWEAPNPAVLAEFDVLRSQVRELTDAVREIRELQSNVGSSIESLVARTAEPEQPTVLSCEAQVFYLPPETGATPDAWNGVRTAEHSAELPWQCRVAGAPLPVVADQLTAGGARLLRQQRTELRQLSPAMIDLSGRLAPRIVESRGGEIREQTAEEPWSGRAVVQWDTLAGDGALLSIRLDSGDEWQQLETAFEQTVVLAAPITVIDPGRALMGQRRSGRIAVVLSMKPAAIRISSKP